MRRMLAIVLSLAAAATLLVVGTGASSGSDYKVRAIFDSANAVINGEQVKIAGVTVGKIDSLDVTPAHKAAVILSITTPGFQDFRADAHCTIRPQSLIGEQFVECLPTQPKPVGTPAAPPLRKIDKGPGAGQYLLPVKNNATPVNIDLINNVLRLPYRQRLTLIINELGSGLAGNTAELRNVIHRANPALQETDKVLAILARENQTLADLTRDSDTVLGPLSRERNRVADFVVKAGVTARATAERGADLQGNLRRFPTFLRQLRPTAARLGAFADQATPTLEVLNSRANEINGFIRELGPFARASVPAFRSLGRTAVTGTDALTVARPIIQDVRNLTRFARPVANNLAAILSSFQSTGGVERLMDYAYYQTTAINGFDSFGHYLRAELLASDIGQCVPYATQRASGCSANFDKSASASAASARAGTLSPATLRAVAALYHGPKTLGRHAKPRAAAAPAPALAPRPARRRRPRAGPAAPPPAAPAQPGPTAAKPAPPSGASGAGNGQAGLLNYLFGGGK